MSNVFGRCLISIGLAVTLLPAQTPVRSFRLDSIEGLKPINVKLNAVEYRGRKAVHMSASANPDGSAVALIPTDSVVSTVPEAVSFERYAADLLYTSIWDRRPVAAPKTL